ncbi:MAG: GtrA family protein [Clostridia bacterium]|nr:GtrA family protein [Clostridia bacterium]
MYDKLRLFLSGYREIAMYVVFGVLTTLVNWLTYYALTRALAVDVTPANALAWVTSVLFAYFTNRRWVFKSAAAGFKAVTRELGAFFSGRIFTGLLDIALLYLAVRWGFSDVISKAVINVIVIAANYAISKSLVFRK